MSLQILNETSPRLLDHTKACQSVWQSATVKRSQSTTLLLRIIFDPSQMVQVSLKNCFFFKSDRIMYSSLIYQIRLETVGSQTSF